MGGVVQGHAVGCVGKQFFCVVTTPCRFLRHDKKGNYTPASSTLYWGYNQPDRKSKNKGNTKKSDTSTHLGAGVTRSWFAKLKCLTIPRSKIHGEG